MLVETAPKIEEKPKVVEALCELWDFSLEKVWISELLPWLAVNDTFIATSFIENICNRNPEALKILNKAV